MLVPEFKNHLFTPDADEITVFINTQDRPELALDKILKYTPEKTCKLIHTRLPKILKDLEKGSYPEVILRSALRHSKEFKDSLLMFVTAAYLHGMLTTEGLLSATEVLYDIYTKYPMITIFGDEFKQDGPIDTLMNAIGFSFFKYIISHPTCFELLNYNDNLIKAMLYFMALCDLGTMLKNKKYAFKIKVSSMGPYNYNLSNSLLCFIKLYSLLVNALLSGTNTSLLKRFNAYLEGRISIKSIHSIVNSLLGVQEVRGVEH